MLGKWWDIRVGTTAAIDNRLVRVEEEDDEVVEEADEDGDKEEPPTGAVACLPSLLPLPVLRGEPGGDKVAPGEEI